MRRLAIFGLSALIASATLCDTVRAQTTTTGSTGCAATTQAGVNGLNARIQADDSNINAPQSVTSLTCLDNFFNGVGLNLVTNLLNPANLLQGGRGEDLQPCATDLDLAPRQGAMRAHDHRLQSRLRRSRRRSLVPETLLRWRRPVDRDDRHRVDRQRPLHQRHRHRTDRIQPAECPAGHILR
jgi:hypothetical protein